MFIPNRLGMIQSLETMCLQTQKLNQISNNLANADTTGYKKSQVAFEEVLLHTTGDRQRVGKGLKVATDFEQGALKETGNPLNMAISGKGFFRIQTPQGIRYTRDGDFHENAQGRLVTADGYTVLSQGGPIQLGGQRPQVDAQGNIWAGGSRVGRLAVVSFADQGALVKEGNNLYRLKNGQTGGQPAQNYSVQQGYLEASNVNTTSAMVHMIELSRIAESQQKVISTIDNLDEIAASQVGTLSTNS